MADKRKILAGIMAKAHFNTRFKIIGGFRKPYREVFAEMLRLAWAEHRRAEESKKDWRIRQQLRDESNVALPLRSTPADYRRTYHRSSRAVAAIGA
jgi:hypothetical protein